jgi:uncharacterized membrane protein YdfJ with MMPL/SSD domain
VLDRLAGLAARRRWVLLGCAFLFLAVAGPFGGPVANVLTSGGTPVEDPGAESVHARETLLDATGVNPEPGSVVLVSPGASVRSGAGRARVEEVAATVRRDPAVGDVITPYEPAGRADIARDGRSAYLLVLLKRVSGNAEGDAADRLQAAFEGQRDVTLGGRVITNDELNKQVQSDLKRAEAVAFPILFLLALLVFRGVVAALLPIIAGVFAILGTFLALRIANTAVSLSIYALNLVTAVGLGLAIDYSLFIVSRYREEVAAGRSGVDALRGTLTSAGRTVLFSAMTVTAALAVLLVFPQKFLYSMGVGGIFVGIVSAAFALLVLPALLAVLGPRVNALSLPGRRPEATAGPVQSGFWYRLAETVMRRPVPIAAVTAAAMIALGVPFLGIKFTGVDATVLPKSATAHQVEDVLDRDYPTDRTTPTYAVVSAPSSARAEVDAYARRLRDLPDAAASSPPEQVTPRLWRIDVLSRAGRLDDESKDLVREMRDATAPFPVRVGGETASFVDQQHSLADHLPIAIAILVVLTTVLLFLMTGSVILPVKALIINLLTLSAGFGLLVLIFQDGRLEGLLDYASQGAINSTVPLLVGAVGFALSTDYAVFLLSRIKEARDAGRSNRDAVAFGLERTGRIVTAAALLFCIAVGAFTSSKIIFIKEIGLGIVALVIIDATVMRALLVPALMKLLGEWNWWAPRRLQRLHDRIGITEAG